jgi:hypothetical protein
MREKRYCFYLKKIVNMKVAVNCNDRKYIYKLSKMSMKEGKSSKESHNKKLHF